MKRTIVALLFLLSGGVVSFMAQQATKGSIGGNVTVAGSGQPLPDARVTLTLLGPDGNPVRGNPPTPTVSFSAMTGNTGEYTVKDLEAGSYRLAVMADGFARTEYGPILKLEAGETLKGIPVRMRPAGTISGRALDTSGQPAVGVTVSALRREYSATGSTTLNQVATAKTNDLGEYRMYWVTPGRYALRAEGSGGVETYARTYFPGVDDEAKAGTIDVAGGAEVRGIDFTLAPSRLYTIRGQVIDSATGQPPAEASIILGTEDGGGSSASDWYDRKTGAIKIYNLIPGKYSVALSARPMGSRMGTLDPSAARAVANVVIRDADAQVLLTLAIPPIIKGQIRVEGDLPASPANLRVSFTKEDGAYLSSLLFNANATSAEDGTFSLAGIAEGEYRVTIRNLPGEFFLKEARLQGRDVLNNVASFSAAGELDLIISAKGGRLEGTVRDSQRQPLPSIQTVLVPEEQRNRPDLFKRVFTDRSGKFTISGIAPGNYRVFAWADLEAYSYFDPEVLKKYEAQGKRLHIAEWSAQTVEIDVIPPEGP